MKKPHSDMTRIVLGGFVILVGVLALLQNILGIQTRQILQFWPVVFLLVGVIKFSQARSGMSYLLGGVLFAAGVLMTLHNLEIIEFRLREWWPVAVIVVGASMIFRDSLHRQTSKLLPDSLQTAEIGSTLTSTVLMSGGKLNVLTQDFRQGELTCIMGGIEIDLRQASMESVAVIQVTVIMGGIVLRLPPDWSVDSRSVNLMGGVDDKTIPPAQTNKRLIIEGLVLMGGLELKN
jgi:predicted membrane protein